MTFPVILFGIAVYLGFKAAIILPLAIIDAGRMNALQRRIAAQIEQELRDIQQRIEAEIRAGYEHAENKKFDVKL